MQGEGLEFESLYLHQFEVNMFEQIHEDYLAVFLAKGHNPQLDETGKPDSFALDFEDDCTGHNGYRCVICEFTACIWCNKEIPPC